LKTAKRLIYFASILPKFGHQGVGLSLTKALFSKSFQWELVGQTVETMVKNLEMIAS
jgi:hypothetical protein